MSVAKEKRLELKKWLITTQHAPVNKDIDSVIKRMGPSLDKVSEINIAAFIYNFEKGGYTYFNDYFVKIMNEDRSLIQKEGIKLLQKKVHKEDFSKCLNLTQKAFFEFLRMKPKEQQSFQFRFFFRMKKKMGEYAWFMQTSKSGQNVDKGPPMEIGYLVELFDLQHPLRVMGIIETNFRRSEIFPDGIDDLINKLSKREFEILQLARQGIKTKVIAEKLQLAENTIKTHRRNILKKLEVANIVQAISLIDNENDSN
jgi:DNA-binding CsgD family transcriptional regulator